MWWNLVCKFFQIILSLMSTCCTQYIFIFIHMVRCEWCYWTYNTFECKVISIILAEIIYLLNITIAILWFNLIHNILNLWWNFILIWCFHLIDQILISLNFNCIPAFNLLHSILMGVKIIISIFILTAILCSSGKSIIRTISLIFVFRVSIASVLFLAFPWWTTLRWFYTSTPSLWILWKWSIFSKHFFLLLREGIFLNVKFFGVVRNDY